MLAGPNRAVFGFNQLGDPTFDDANSTGQGQFIFGRIGVHSLLAGVAMKLGLFLGGCRTTGCITEPFNPADDPNMASNNSRYHSYRKRYPVEQHRCISATCSHRACCRSPI